MKFRAALFDLDGTLLNTLDDLGSSMNRVLGRFGFPQHPMESYKTFVGEGISVLAARALPKDHCDEPSIKACVEAMSTEYANHWLDVTKPYNEIELLLEGLTKRDFKLAVLSNKPHAMTSVLVAYYFPKTRFNCVNGAREGVPKKPHPLGAIEIARGLRIAPEEFIYLGDSGVDMETAVSAGMFPVGALWGFREKGELLAHGAKAVITHPLELLDFADDR
jgi:phosphoglycolate phosphatase